MNIKELFEKSSYDEVWGIICDNFYNKDTLEKQENAKKAFFKAYNKILTLTPICRDDIILLVEYFNDTNSDNEIEKYLSIYVYEKKDILNNFKINEDIENNVDYSNKTKEEIMKTNTNNDYIVNYGIELESWNNILGFDIYNKSIDKYGINKCVAVVLYEMTWFGYNEETIHEKAEELNEASEETDNKKTFNSFEELILDTFGEDSEEYKEITKNIPTKEELEKQFLKDLLLGYENKKILYWQLKDIYTSINSEG